MCTLALHATWADVGRSLYSCLQEILFLTACAKCEEGRYEVDPCHGKANRTCIRELGVKKCVYSY